MCLIRGLCAGLIIIRKPPLKSGLKGIRKRLKCLWASAGAMTDWPKIWVEDIPRPLARLWAWKELVSILLTGRFKRRVPTFLFANWEKRRVANASDRSEEHTSELQSQSNLVC